MVRRVAIVLSLLVVVLTTIAFFAGLVAKSQPEDDVFYVNFKASPIYAKAGFEPTYSSLTSPEGVDWSLELPANYDSSVLMSKLPDKNTSSLGSLNPVPNQPVDDFTILIPFVITPEAFEELYDQNNLVNPGIYLEGIGDNWEIYLNGEMALNRNFVNADGVITEHHSQRGVFFPVPRLLLYEGDNTLVIHAYGAWDSAATGLFYASHYYLGNYTNIMVRAMSLDTIAFCTVFLFLGIYHALLFLLRRRNINNLLYGVFSTCVAVYFFTRSPVIYQFIVDTSIAQRLEYSVLLLVPFALAAFLETIDSEHIGRVTKLFGLFCLLMITAFAVTSIYFVERLLNVAQVVGVLFIVYVFVQDVAHALVKRTKQAVSETTSFGSAFIQNIKGTMLGNISVFLLVFILTAIYDVFDTLFLHADILLTRYSFLILTVLMAFVLARSYANSFETTAQLNELLDNTVRQRTIELEEQVLIAQSASRAKGDFLANMSHEIRTPLNAVIGMTTIGAKASESQRKDYAFERIREASEHLLGVINDILDMSKIEAGKLELSKVVFSVRDVIGRVSNVLRFKTDDKNQQFVVSVDQDVPAVLYGDDLRLAQVITNLVGNAVKFTPMRGRIELNISLASETVNTSGQHLARLQVLVIDSGIGITDEQKSRLFQTFAQAENSTTRSYGGTGLGLALSRQIVELMDGEIWVTSTLGEGSTFGFTVLLPIADAEALKAAAADVEELKAGEFAGYTVLIAEDVAVNREIVHALLEPSELNIIDAEDGRQAVDMFNADPEGFDLILMDVQMPVLDGYDATQEIRNSEHVQGKTLPIIAMTANVFREDIERSLQSGMNAHLGKPIDIQEMVTTLRTYMLRQ